MKKLFAMLLALCMLCGVVSAGAEEAAEDIIYFQSGVATVDCLSFQVPEGWYGGYGQTDGTTVVVLMNLEGQDLIQMTISPTIKVDGFPITADYYLSFMQLAHTGEFALSVEYDIIGWLAGEEFIRDVKGYTGLLTVTDESTGQVEARIDETTGKAMTALISNLAWVSDELDMVIQIEHRSMRDVAEMVEIGNELVRSFRYQGEKGTYDFVRWTEDSVAENQEDAFSGWNLGGLGGGFGTPDTSATTESAVERYIIITGSGVNIRKGATTDAPVLAKGNKGDTFPYLGESGAWYKIDVNGQTGYVSMGLAEIK